MKNIYDRRIKIAVFDTKQNDIDYFNAANHDGKYELIYFEQKLEPDTAPLAVGCDAVCVFTNDTVNKEVINILSDEMVEFIALRCAGHNNVDLVTAHKKIHVANVPNYSPYSVAEHTMAMLLTSVRRIHKAYNRTNNGYVINLSQAHPQSL